MTASELLDKSHVLVIQAMDDLRDPEWDIPGADGDWSVKDVIAHLASYERLLVDVLTTFPNGEATPTMLKFVRDRKAFERDEVESRKYMTAQQVENEYNDLQIQSTSLLFQIPNDTVQRKGTLTWYNQEASLADLVQFVVNDARQRCAQIIQFREKREQQKA